MKGQENGEPIALEAYETLAERYAELVDSKPENAYYERPATLSLLPDVAGKRVLDAGCGPGAYSEWLADHGAHVVAIDVSPKMVHLARQRLQTRVEVLQADLRKPLDSLEDASFDIVVSPLVLDYIRDWRGVFAEFSRVLRVCGLLVFSVEHPFLKVSLLGADDYFATELGETEWRGFGIRVRMPSYRRPLGAMISPLAEAGLVVERIVEPRPTETFRRKDPEGYEKLSRSPGFLCIRARKDQR
ncbi:MAG: methyltransferase domain-containing protein [Anaerolineae bacterium]|jgi:SAM-dependent methyltransferase